MKKAMKKRITKGALGTFCALALFIAGGENPTPHAQIIWTTAWLVLAGFAGLFLGIMLKEDKEIWNEEI